MDLGGFGWVRFLAAAFNCAPLHDSDTPARPFSVRVFPESMKLNSF
jgi:hypothetical protein